MNSKRSYKGMLIEVIINYVIENFTYEFETKFKNILQEALDSNLKFETKVSDINIVANMIIGQIQFTDENGTVKANDFTITRRNQIDTEEHFT